MATEEPTIPSSLSSRREDIRDLAARTLQSAWRRSVGKEDERTILEHTLLTNLRAVQIRRERIENKARNERRHAERNCAAQRIQRALSVFSDRLREEKLRSRAEKFETCARCFAAKPTHYVFDLTQAFCLACVEALSRDLVNRDYALTRRGVFVGIAMELERKRAADAAASRLQKWWRNLAKAALLKNGACSLCTSRAATHVDHGLHERLLCRRCAGLAIMTLCRQNTSRNSRIQSLVDRDRDYWAGCVVQHFFLRAHRVRRWLATERAYLALSIRAATTIERNLRGKIIRNIVRTCDASLHLLFASMKARFQRNPGMWVLHLHVAVLSNVPRFLVGEHLWIAAGKPVFYKRHATMMYVTESAALMISRVVRGSAGKRQLQKLRDKAERWRVEIECRYIARQESATQSLQRAARGFVARCQKSRRIGRKIAAMQVADRACNVQERCADAAAIWKSHQGFLGACTLSPEAILGGSLGLFPHTLRDAVADQCVPCMTLGTITKRLQPRVSHNSWTNALVGGELTVALAVSPDSRAYAKPSQQEHRVEREGGTAPSFETLPQFPVRLPLVLILQVIQASDRESIFVSWCGEDIGCSSDDEGPLTIGAGRFAERQSTFYLSCDAKRHPRFFRQRDSPLLTLSTTSAEHARMTATDLLCGLGTRRTLQVSKTNVTILVSVEPTARTETRSVVSSVVASVLNDVIHQVAILIPHVKCCLISYQCLLRSNGAGLGNEAIRARLTWNGMDAGDVTIPTFDKERDIFDAQEFVLPVDVARDQAGQAKSKQIDLNIDLASEFGERPWGIARLDDECFEGDGYRTARANVYTHPSTSDFSTPRQQLIGFLHMQTEAFKIPVAPWRQRRGVIEKYVESVVESALERIPQPRVVLTLADATELQTQNENSTIEFRVFWNDTLHSVWRSPNAVGGPLKIKKSSTLFLPAHLLFVPDLKIEVFNVKNDKVVECCLGVARVRGSELVKMCGRIDLDLFEPLASTKKTRRMLNVHRVVPGRVGLSIKTIQIPNHLSDPHISLSATQVGDTTSDEPSTIAMVSSITALRLALIDLEIDDNMGTHSSLKRNKNAIEHLFARGNPYAVVRWHHVEVGYEEIMRNSLRSLAADGSFLQSFMAAAAGSNLPRQSNLVFSGTPYSFPLTSDAPRKEFDVNVSIDIYAVEEESLEHSQKKRNRFLGQARLDQWSFDRTSASHLKLPLRRRQSDTLNDAIVHLEIKDVTGTEITITALRAAELSSSGTGLLFHRGDSKVQVRFQLVRFTDRNGQEQRVEVDSAHSSSRSISGSCARWPSEEAIALHFPLSEDVEPEKLLKVAVWRLQKPAIQIGSAEWFFPAKGSSIDEIVTLRLSTLHGKPHGSIAFQIRVGEYGARASARSATALNGSFHEPQSPSSTPVTRAKWRNSGGDAENAAVTLRIADPRLLRKPLTIAITSKNRTAVGSATFDMKRFAVEENAATSFETRLENSHEHPDDHKVVRFTAWLERTQYYCLCASRIRLSNMSVSDRPIYVSLRFAESTARTKSISDLGLILNEHTSLQLPASLRQIQRRKLCVEVWLDGDGGDAPSDLLLARSSVSIGSVLVAMENDAPLCLTAPLISRNRRRDECCGMLSLILICTEIKDIREEDFSRGDGVRSALAAMKAPSPPAKARPVALIIGNIKAHNLRTKDSLQCVVRIGQQIARTTVSSSREDHCWRSEVLCIESDIDVVIGGMIEIEVHSQSPSGVLGQSTVYLTPRRFLAFCDDKLRAILGYEQNISDESLTYNKNVAVKLRRFGDSITIALLTFEMHASMEPIQSDARESSQRTPQVPDDHASNVAAIQRSTSKTVAPQRHISFMSMSNEKGLDDAIEGEEKKGRSSVPNVATDKDIPATVNERSNALFWLGGAFRLTNIPHRADDETCISNNEEKLDGNKPESEAEASFLIGKHDDVPETVRVRRQRKRPSKLDRNELRVCVLQGRGIWGGASHPRSEKYRTAKKPSKVHVVLRVVGDDDTSPSQKTSAQEGTNPEWNERFVLPAFEPVPHENGNMQNTASLLALEISVKGRESREIYGTATTESLPVNSFVGTGLVPLEGPDAPAGIKEGKVLRRWILLRDRSCGRRTVASQTMQDEPRPSSLWGNNACRKMNDYSLDAGAVQIAM